VDSGADFVVGQKAWVYWVNKKVLEGRNMA